MLSLENRQTQALWQLSIFISLDPVLEKPVERFCNRTSIFKELEKKQLLRHFCHSEQTYKDCQLPADKNYNKYSWLSKSYH